MHSLKERKRTMHSERKRTLCPTLLFQRGKLTIFTILSVNVWNYIPENNMFYIYFSMNVCSTSSVTVVFYIYFSMKVCSMSSETLSDASRSSARRSAHLPDSSHLVSTWSFIPAHTQPGQQQVKQQVKGRSTPGRQQVNSRSTAGQQQVNSNSKAGQQQANSRSTAS